MSFSDISRGNGKPVERVYESHAHYSIDIGMDLSVVASRLEPLSGGGEDEAALCISCMFAF